MTVPDGEMYVSSARSSRNLAGVFEYIERTGYFYLYNQARKGGQRIVASIHVLSGEPDFAESEVNVRWTPGEESVGPFIRGQLWAAFRGEEKFGGSYRSGGRPNMPNSVAAAFERRGSGPSTTD